MDGQYYNFSNPRIKDPHLLYGLKLYPVCLDRGDIVERNYVIRQFNGYTTNSSI